MYHTYSLKQIGDRHYVEGKTWDIQKGLRRMGAKWDPALKSWYFTWKNYQATTITLEEELIYTIKTEEQNHEQA